MIRLVSCRHVKNKQTKKVICEVITSTTSITPFGVTVFGIILLSSFFFFTLTQVNHYNFYSVSFFGTIVSTCVIRSIIWLVPYYKVEWEKWAVHAYYAD